MKTVFKILAFVALLLLVIGLGPRACTRPDDARRVLQQQGYAEVQITGWRPLMAGKDVFSTGFRAKSVSGAEVTGAVTSSLFKGSTIRLD